MDEGSPDESYASGEDEAYNSDDEPGLDDDEGYNEPPKKKRKHSHQRSRSSGVIDDMAEDDEDDEEDEEGDEDDLAFASEFITHDGEITGGNAEHRSILGHNVRRDHIQAQMMVRKINDRFQHTQHIMDGGIDDDGQRSAVSQEARQPSTRDAKLWLVKCVPGAERSLVTRILHKYTMMKQDGQPLQILSVVSQDHLKGMLYIEAFRESHVRDAIKDLQGIYGRDIKSLDLAEMVPVMSVPRKTLSVKKDDWVRVKMGVYHGDIGQIVDYDETQQEATVKLIPRISELEDDDDEAPSGNKRTRDGENKKGVKKDNRPAPALFDVAKMEALFGEEVESHGAGENEYYKFRKNKYKDGFHYKTIMLKGLHLNVKPLYEDIQAFSRISKNKEDEEDELLDRVERTFAAQARSLSMQGHKETFEKGDRVEVVEGELKGLIGEVQSVTGDVVYVISKHKSLTTALPWNSAQLRKHFKPGDHVRIINGKSKGESGTIIKLEKETIEIATVITDLSKTEVKVFTHDIQISASTDVSTSASLGDFGYKRLEFVKIVPNTFGVVISVDSESVSVLGTDGKIHQVPAQNIQQRRNTAKTVGHDADRNPVGKGDLVRVVKGDSNVGQTGSILHIFKWHAFIHNRTIAENNGVFVVRCGCCKLQGTSKNAQHLGHGRRETPGIIAAKPSYGYGATKQGPRNNPILNKIVSITKGPYKGHVGMAKGSTAKEVTVLLQTTHQRVNVPAEWLQVLIDQRNSSSNVAGNATPRSGGATPAYPATPAYRSTTPATESAGYSAYSSSRVNTPLDLDLPSNSVRDTRDKDTGNLSSSSSYHGNLSSTSSTPATTSSYHSINSTDIRTPGTSFDIRTPGTSFDIRTPGTSFDIRTPGTHFELRTPGTAFEMPGSVSGASLGSGGGGTSTGGASDYPPPATPGTHMYDLRNPATPGTPNAGAGGFNTFDYRQAPATPGTPGTSFSYPGSLYSQEFSGLQVPGTPGTPAASMYPGTPSAGMYDQSPLTETPLTPMEDDGNWWCKTAEVIIQDSSSPYNDRKGYIKDSVGSMCVVGVYDSNDSETPREVAEATVSGVNLIPVKPEKKDQVIVIRGPNKGQSGSLIGMDSGEGIVNINDTEIIILSVDFLAKQTSM